METYAYIQLYHDTTWPPPVDAVAIATASEGRLILFFVAVFFEDGLDRGGQRIGGVVM